MSSLQDPFDGASPPAHPELADPRYARAAAAAFADFVAMTDALKALPPGHSRRDRLAVMLHSGAPASDQPPLPTLKSLRAMKKSIVRIRRSAEAALNQHETAAGMLPGHGGEPYDRNRVILEKAVLQERIIDLKIEQVQNAWLLRRLRQIVSMPKTQACAQPRRLGEAQDGGQSNQEVL